MNRTEHLLVKLAEECAEVAQRATKALRFGLLEVQPGQPLNNAERLVGELTDLYAVIDLLAKEGAISAETLDLEPKRARIEKYLAYSASLGTLSTHPQGTGRRRRRQPTMRAVVQVHRPAACCRPPARHHASSTGTSGSSRNRTTGPTSGPCGP